MYQGTQGPLGRVTTQILMINAFRREIGPQPKMNLRMCLSHQTTLSRRRVRTNIKKLLQSPALDGCWNDDAAHDKYTNTSGVYVFLPVARLFSINQLSCTSI